MPQRIATVDQEGYWIYRGMYFWDNHWMPQKQVWDLLDQRLPTVLAGAYPKLRVVQNPDPE